MHLLKLRMSRSDRLSKLQTHHNQDFISHFGAGAAGPVAPPIYVELLVVWFVAPKGPAGSSILAALSELSLHGHRLA